MKQTPDLDLVQAAMQPGVITRDGFLGDDRRKLVEILIEDDAQVARMGLSHERIAQRMRELRERGCAGLGETVALDGDTGVRVDSVRGKLPCPFGHRGLVPKINTTVSDRRDGRSVTYTDLNIHMIEAHAFYEGRGSPFRLDPRALADLLGLLPRE